MRKYPTITQYLSTVSNTCAYRTLTNISPVKNNNMENVFSAGNYSVIHKVSIGGSYYAMKCFTKNYDDRIENLNRISELTKSINSKYFTEIDVYDKEIFITDEYGNGDYYPAVVWRWIEGSTLTKCLSVLCRREDRKALNTLAKNFDEMALWLLDQDFAHGDIKGDNIIVSKDLELQLIDYDGMFLTGIKDKYSREIGARCFQHPARNKYFFNRHLDDYSLALISTSLHALAIEPSLFKKFNNGENIIFTPSSIFSKQFKTLEKLKQKWFDSELYGLYLMAETLTSETPVIENLREIFLMISNNKTNLPLTHYNMIDSTFNKRATVIKNGLYGFIKDDSEVLIYPVFEAANHFKEDVTAVKHKNGWFLIDIEGKRISNYLPYESIEGFSEGMAIVSNGKQYGYIDLSGNEAISLQYENAKPFSQGKAHVTVNSALKTINKTGKLI